MASRKDQKEQLRREREATQQADAGAAARRKRTAYLAGGMALIAMIVVVALVLVSQSGDDSPNVDGADLFAEIPQTGTELGDPKAPVTVVEFADLQCPICRNFATGELPGIIEDYVEPGDVKMELRLLAFIGEESTFGRSVAAGAAAQDRIWPLVENIYSNQGAENGGWLTEDFLRGQSDGIAGLDIGEALADSQGRAAQRYADKSDSEAGDAGVTGTPSFLVGPRGGEMELVKSADGLRDAIDAALSQAGR